METGLSKYYLLLSIFILLSCNNKKEQSAQGLSIDTISTDLISDTIITESLLVQEEIDDYWKYYNTETKEGVEKLKSLGEDVFESYSRMMGMELPSEEEMTVGLALIKETLSDNSFKEVTDSLFTTKMSEVFGISDLNNDPNIYRFNSYKVYARNPLLGDNDEIILDNAADIYFSNSNFIFPSFFLFNLIDIKATKASRERKIKKQVEIIHRNRYVFYNDRESFLFMQNHDAEFLKNLVLIYNYDKDDELLNWVSKINQ